MTRQATSTDNVDSAFSRRGFLAGATAWCVIIKPGLVAAPGQFQDQGGPGGPGGQGGWIAGLSASTAAMNS